MITKVEPSPEVKKMLETWREPRFAYVLFETKVRNFSKDSSGNFPSEPTIQRSTMTLNVESRPDVGAKLNYYLRKGYKIIHWGNFPKTNDAIPSRAQMVRLHSGAKGENPWDSLAQELAALSRQTNHDWQNEKSALEDKLAKALAAVEKQKKKESGSSKRE